MGPQFSVQAISKIGLDLNRDGLIDPCLFCVAFVAETKGKKTTPTRLQCKLTQPAAMSAYE